ncbi:hypothetical protein GOBAR_DD09167 [Gossypium barbadense]|nr:hypothetical protein GOBAR_DD09167 [Gossypium barbadense]
MMQDHVSYLCKKESHQCGDSQAWDYGIGNDDVAGNPDLGPPLPREHQKKTPPPSHQNRPRKTKTKRQRWRLDSNLAHAF